MRVQTDRQALFKTDEEALAYIREPRNQAEILEALGPWIQILIRNHEIEIGKIAERRAQLVQVEAESREILPGKAIPGHGKIDHQWRCIKLLQAVSQSLPRMKDLGSFGLGEQ